MATQEHDGDWTEIIEAHRGFLDLRLTDVWRYRDLLFMFVRRDFVAQYKQTVLGPIWFLIQPLLTTLIFTVIFGRLAGIGTDGVPHMLFYLSGITLWNYFADSLTMTSSVFRMNQATFGKVYFPRLVTPLSIVISNLFRLGIQMLLFLVFWLWYLFVADVSLQPNFYALLTPFLILLLAGLGLGLGMVITSLTSKYRDLEFLLAFGVQLFMYATPVIYPLSTLSEGKRFWLVLNPVTSIVETFKYGMLGRGTFDWFYLGYSTLFTAVVLFLGVVVFHRTEQNFMDSV